MANLNGMANYVAMQLRRGVAVDGTRVVSEANLAECWKPHVDVPIAAALDPDAVSYGYGMGWMSVMYDGGIRLVWHNGAADGFSTYLGFFPEENIGYRPPDQRRADTARVALRPLRPEPVAGGPVRSQPGRQRCPHRPVPGHRAPVGRPGSTGAPGRSNGGRALSWPLRKGVVARVRWRRVAPVAPKLAGDSGDGDARRQLRDGGRVLGRSPAPSSSATKTARRGWTSRMSSACVGWSDPRSGRARGAKPARRRPRTPESSGTCGAPGQGARRRVLKPVRRNRGAIRWRSPLRRSPRSVRKAGILHLDVALVQCVSLVDISSCRPPAIANGFGGADCGAQVPHPQLRRCQAASATAAHLLQAGCDSPCARQRATHSTYPGTSNADEPLACTAVVERLRDRVAAKRSGPPAGVSTTSPGPASAAGLTDDLSPRP